MRALRADYIFPICSPPIKNGVIILKDDGNIENILTSEQFTSQLQTSNLKPQTFSGIICPGFINAHCHLELSHLKGRLSTGKGLPHFIGEILAKRDVGMEQIESAIVAAEEEMINNGIVAVGDICNTTHTIFQKKKNRLKYHSFIELFDLHPDRADEEFEKGMKLLAEFETLSHTSSITPHAPYSVSKKLLAKINDWSGKHKAIVSIHNQETASENEMFLKGGGALFDKLLSLVQNAPFAKSFSDAWKATGLTSLASIMDYVLGCEKILLIHNTFTSKEDIAFANAKSQIPDNVKIFWCFCPNANLFIENKLPDYKIFIDRGCKITVGTDSYASNWSLSILDELKTISKHAPWIKLDELLKWATINGAEFYSWDKGLGSIEKGKKPGLNLITNIDYKSISLTEKSEVKPL